jgi:hypothetical protein
VLQDFENFRVAHDRLLATDPDAALDLVSFPMWHRYEHVGPLREGRERVATSLARARPDAPARGRALLAAERLAMFEGDIEAAERFAHASVEALRDGDDVRMLVLAMSHSANYAIMRGDRTGGLAGHEQTVAFARGSGDDWTLAVTLNNMADGVSDQDPERAMRLLEESLLHRSRAGDLGGIVLTRANLAEVQLHAGRLDEAESHASWAHRAAVQMDDDQFAAWTGAQLAAVGVLRADETDARRWLHVTLASLGRLRDVRTEATVLTVAGALAAATAPSAAAPSTEGVTWAGESTRKPSRSMSSKSDLSNLWITRSAALNAQIWRLASFASSDVS